MTQFGGPSQPVLATPGFNTVEAQTFDRQGRASIFVQDNAYGSPFARMKAAALGTADPSNPEISDAVSSSVFGWLGARSNRKDYNRFVLGIPDSVQFTGANITDVLPAETTRLLAQSGFDFDRLERMDDQQAMEQVGYHIQRKRLADSIEYNTNSGFETAYGSTVTIGEAILLDPLNLVGVGLLGVASKASRVASAAGKTKSAAVYARVSNTVGKLPNVAGVIFNSKNVKLNRAVNSVLYGAGMTAAFDYIDQSKQFEINKKFFEDSAMWEYDYNRGLISAGVGGLLGGTVNALFGIRGFDKRHTDVIDVLDRENIAGGVPRTIKTGQFFAPAIQKFTPEDIASTYAARSIIYNKANTLPPNIAAAVRSSAAQADRFQLIRLASIVQQGGTPQEILAARIFKRQLEQNDENLAQSAQYLDQLETEMADAYSKWKSGRSLARRVPDEQTRGKVMRTTDEARLDYIQKQRRYNDYRRQHNKFRQELNAKAEQAQYGEGYNELVAKLESATRSQDRAMAELEAAHLRMARAQTAQQVQPSELTRMQYMTAAEQLEKAKLKQGSAARRLNRLTNDVNERHAKAMEPVSTDLKKIQAEIDRLYEKEAQLLDILQSSQYSKMTKAQRSALNGNLTRISNRFTKINTELKALEDKIQRGSQTPESLQMVQAIDGLERRRSTPRDLDNQARLMDKLFVDGSYIYHHHNPTLANKIINTGVVRKFAQLGVPRGAIQTEAAADPVFAMVAGMVDRIGLTTSGMTAGQDKVLTLVEAYGRLRRQVANKAYEPTRQLRKAMGNKSDIDTALSDALRVAANMTTSDNPHVNAVAKAYRQFYDEMAARGARVGIIPKPQEDYVSISMNPTMLARHRQAVQDALHSDYMRSYADFNKPDLPLHKGTLNYIRFTEVRDGKRVITGSLADDLGVDPLDLNDVDVPTTYQKFAQLVGNATDPDTGRYWTDLYRTKIQEALRQDAHAAISRKATRGGTYERSGSPDDEPLTRFTGRIGKFQRSIHQRVFLSDQVMQLGVVDLDPTLNMLNYVYGQGNRIARQEAVNEFTGRTDIQFQGLLRFAQNRMKNNNPEYQNGPGQRRLETLMESLRIADKEAAGRMALSGQGQTDAVFVARLIQNIATTPVNAGVPVAMATVELPAALIQAAFKDPGLAMRKFFKAFRDSNFSREQMEATGHVLDFAVHENRVFGDAGFAGDGISYGFSNLASTPTKRVLQVARGNQSPRSFKTSNDRVANTIIAGSEWLSDTTRAFNGQVYLTNRSRAGTTNFERSLFGKRLDKVQKFSEAMKAHQGKTGQDLVRAIKTESRKAGFGTRWGDAHEYMNAGLTDPYILQGFQMLRQAGVKQFSNMADINRAVSNIADRTSRAKATEAVNRLLDYSVDRADSIIIKPPLWDRPSHSAHPINQIFNSFLSYARGFRSRRLQNIADKGSASALFWFSTYAMMQVMNANAKMIIFGGKSLEEMEQMWQQDAGTMLRRSLAQVPLAGPWQSAVLDTIAGLFGADQPVRIGGTASTGITGSIINDAMALRSGRFGKEQAKRLSKVMPGLNTVPVQFLLNALLEDDN